MNQMKRWVSLEFRRFKGNGTFDGLRTKCDSCPLNPTTVIIA